MPGNTARTTITEYRACPTITPTEAATYADRALTDAQDLITDVRDLDPRQVYGRLILWGQESPARLVTVTVALAAMCNPDTTTSAALAWLNPLSAAA